MRVVWDVTPLARAPTGIGTYVLEVVRAAGAVGPPHEQVALSVADPGRTRAIDRHLGTPAGVRRRRVVLPGARAWRTIANRLPLPLLEPLAGAADAFVSSEWLYPRQRRGVRAAIVHDLIPVRFPELVSPATLRMHRAKLDDTRRADIVFCNSAATADDVEALLGVPRVRLRVARPGVAARFRDARPAVPGPAGGRPYILSVCRLEPRKNLVTLVDAFALLRRRRPELALVLVGPDGWGGDPVARRADELGLGEAVVRTGYVPADVLPSVVAGARAFCLPSLFEGFGMPVPEAMAAGVPVVASDHPSLDEACGLAALRASPHDAAALAAALERAAFDEPERRRLVEAGRHHAAGLTWEACARAILDGLAAAASAASRR